MPGRRTYYLLLPVLAAGLFSCAELPTIEEDRCGNGFIEAGEDCDELDSTVKKGEDAGATASCNAPGTVNQCRFRCDGDEQCQSAPVSAAGSGWRCGVDHVCRQPLGADHGKGTFFEPVSTLVPGSADELFAGDFDGDGRKDVLGMGQAGFDVHYFTQGGVEAKSVSVAGAPVVPAIGKLTSSAADDFTIDVGRGTGVMLGGLGATIAPTSYPTLDIAKRYGGVAPDDMRLFILDSGARPRPMALAIVDDVMQVIDASAPVDDLQKVVLETTKGAGRKRLLGNIPVSFLKTQGDRQRFLLAYEGEPSVTVVDVQPDLFPKSTVIRSNVALPAGFTVHGAAFFQDVDLDGLADMVVGTAQCDGAVGAMTCPVAELAVAYGDGNGGFYAVAKSASGWDALQKDKAAHYIQMYPIELPIPMPPPPAPAEREIEQLLPLAIGRINNDNDLDYVNALGIFVSNSTHLLPCVNAANEYCRAERPSVGGIWSEARIADFNADGRVDVVGVSPGLRGIDFFNGTGTGIFNTFSLPTEGVPQSLAIGDFDGDLVADIAFDSVTHEIDKVAKNQLLVDVHTLFTAFGSSSGPPAPPANMGVVPNLLRLVAGNLSSLGDDAATDLMLLSGVQAKLAMGKKVDGSDWKVGLSLGNGYRQLQASMVFFEKGSLAIHGVPVASAIGLFGGTNATTIAHADLATVIMRRRNDDPFDTTSPGSPICDFGAELWLLPATGEAYIDPPADFSKGIGFKTGAAWQPLLPIRRFVETVPINVKGGADELLIAFPSYSSCEPKDLAKADTFGKLYLASFPPGGDPVLTPLVENVGQNQFLVHLRVGDVDGDGNPDIVALKTGLSLDKIQPLRTSVVMLRGKGDGTFADAVDVPVDGFPIDIALVNAEGNSDPEIVVVAELKGAGQGAALFVVDWDATSTDPQHPFKTLLPGADATVSSDSAGSVLELPTALVGGDFDGDGVDDVVVAVAGGVRLFKGVVR